MQKDSRKAEVSGCSVVSVDAAWVCACMSARMHVCVYIYSPRRGGIACQIRDQLVHCVRERARAHRKETGIKPKAVGYQVTPWWLGACPRG